MAELLRHLQFYPVYPARARTRLFPGEIGEDNGVGMEHAHPLRLRFFLHNDDAHHHFFPLSDFAFQSPVSYWDAAHYGHIVAPIEVLATLAVSVYMFRRLQTRASRWFLVGVNVFSVMGYFVFALI